MGKLHNALKKAEVDRGTAAPARPAAPSSAAGSNAQSPAGTAAGAAAGTAATPIYVPAAMRGDVDPHLVAVADPRSELAEQYRTLRTGLLELARANSWKVFLVTSCVAREGKSITAANLACTLAEQTDKKIVLLDADLRAPSQHQILSVDNQRGLSDYLAGGSMLEMALQRSRLPNMWVLPAGRTPANPAELLAGKRMDDLLARLRRDYDYVVVDSPSVTVATDAAVLSPRSDGVLLVVRMAQTQRDTVKQSVELLKKAKANVLGTVLTCAPGADAAKAAAAKGAASRVK